MAELYRYQGRLAEARTLFGRSLEIMLKAFGPGHPGVAITLYNLAVLYADERAYPKAYAASQQAVDILAKRMLGTAGPGPGLAPPKGERKQFR